MAPLKCLPVQICQIAEHAVGEKIAFRESDKPLDLSFGKGPLANASLGAKPDEEIFVGGNAEEMAKHIVTLLTNQEKADQIAHAGYDFTNRVYDWGQATERMEEAMVSQLLRK